VIQALQLHRFYAVLFVTRPHSAALRVLTPSPKHTTHTRAPQGYDAHFWDDYTCVLKGACSPAEASIKDVGAGVTEYTAVVPGKKLVLGLPWYGQRYTRVVLPINEGQIDYKDVLAIEDSRVKSRTLDKDSMTWKIVCHGACVDGKKGGEIWIDDATTLAPKYQLAKDNQLRGVGMWEATKLPSDDKHAKERDAMWAAIAAWDE
jgi:spore germination protein YaaH